jgi:hypothetical protein
MPRPQCGPRWESKFGRFVGEFGVEELAAELSIDATAVYHWVSGRKAPRFENALAIEGIAKRERVRLTIAEIYQHRNEIR